MRTRHAYIYIAAIAATFLMTPYTHAAEITGTATYEGAVPKFKEIRMNADPVCVAKHPGKALPETLVLGDEVTKTLGNVLVRVISGLPKKAYAAPSDPLVLTQAGCTYAPHVLAIMAGQPIKILNPDGTLHTIHALPEINEEFNLSMPAFRKQMTRTFDKVETTPFPLKCETHPWMGGWVSVMDHPFFVVTEPSGQYTLQDLPAGTYEVEAWHEKLPAQKATVTLAEGESKEINFIFSRPSQQ